MMLTLHASTSNEGGRGLLLTVLASLWLLPLLSSTAVLAFHHTDCTWKRASQFSFRDCYLPSLNPNLLLSQVNFVMSHDAATGYLPNNHGISSATNLYAKNQIGGAYQQLQDGARALDVRPKLLQNGTVICHHGAISIPVTLQSLVQDAKRWSGDNPSELVLILHMNLAYENSQMTVSADTAVGALSQVYDALGVTYLSCEDIAGLTVQETMDLAKLSSSSSNSNNDDEYGDGGGGYLLAVDRHDAYASSCAKLNYISKQIVTCYPTSTTTTTTTTTASDGNTNTTTSILPCTNPNSPVFQDLKDYIVASATDEPTDSADALAPPATWDYYPFNAIQALWQVDAHAAAMGVAHLSSLIDDNTKSQINARVVDWMYDGTAFANGNLSLVMVDHVQLSGNALLSVLRTTCGQSQLPDHACGSDLPKPKVHPKHMSTLSFLVTTSVYVAFVAYATCMIRQYRRQYHQNSRELNENETNQEGWENEGNCVCFALRTPKTAKMAISCGTSSSDIRRGNRMDGQHVC